MHNTDVYPRSAYLVDGPRPASPVVAYVLEQRFRDVSRVSHGHRMRLSAFSSSAVWDNTSDRVVPGHLPFGQACLSFV